MIDPWNVCKFDRDDRELQEFWLFCILVANKNAARMAVVTDNICTGLTNPLYDLAKLSETDLHDRLVAHRTGQYKRIQSAILDSAKLCLRTCSLSDLLNVKGVGDKTARYFLVYTRPNQRLAVIDTHIKKYLIERGYVLTGLSYAELEGLMLYEQGNSGMEMYDFDLWVWSRYARKPVTTV